MAVNAPAHQDIVILKGGAFKWRIAVTNKDGSARNLTGYQAKMQIRQDVDDAAAVITLTTGSGITIDFANGYVDILIDKTKTSTLTIPSGVWDVWIDNGGSDSPEYLAAGGVEVRKMVTQ